MRIETNLYSKIKDEGLTLTQILRQQQQYHEYRRWSVFDVIGDRKIQNCHPRDRAMLWHTARAELTTQPAGIRLAVAGSQLAKEIEKDNPIGATIFQAAAAWSARYWLEEEAHHEVGYGLLLEMIGGDPIPQEEVVEHRGFFPDDNYVRVLMLQACVEIEATVFYGTMAKIAYDPLVRDIFLHIMRDEVQHRQYFVAFSQALVDAGVFPAKDALAMAFTWIRPNGETMGSSREKQTERQGFVNWWEHAKTDTDDPYEAASIMRTPELQHLKERGILRAAGKATRQTFAKFPDLQRAYFKSLANKRPSGVSATAG